MLWEFRKKGIKETIAMVIRKLLPIFTALIVCTYVVAAQDPTHSQPEKVIKPVPAESTSPMSGKDMFRAYCASCHGTDGRGRGRAAIVLQLHPTDLTLLSRNNGGRFPTLKVESSIRGEASLPAHGSKEMPVWGSLFWTMHKERQAEVQQRLANLTGYIETLQAK